MSKKFYITVLGVLILLGIVFLFAGREVIYTETKQSTQASAGALREATQQWKERIESIGPKDAYAEFLTVAPTRAQDTHEQAHAFGEALYSVEGLDGLGYCDSSFEFGCYHSFFGVAVAEKGIGVLPEFAEACKAKYGDYNLPCEHGIGHGVLVYTDYENLTKALELCETISNLPTGGCSSGVFMENNFHTMDDSVSEGFIRPIEDGMHAPCKMLHERFQASCYFEQVQWWQNIFNNDFSHIAELCAEVGTYTEKEACYHGMGNYVAAYANFDTDGIGNICGNIHDIDAHSLCLEGASWLLLPESGGREKAEALCAKAKTDVRQNLCLSKL